MKQKAARCTLSAKRLTENKGFKMAKIDLTVYSDRLENTIKRARERNIIIPHSRR